jgi:hypothetical protein
MAGLAMFSGASQLVEWGWLVTEAGLDCCGEVSLPAGEHGIKPLWSAACDMHTVADAYDSSRRRKKMAVI